MANFEVVLTVGRKPPDPPIQKSVTVEDISNPQVAAVEGLKELFAWGAEDLKANPAEAVIPSAAIEYWTAAVRNGGLQLYEILMKLEADWGITCNTRPVESTVSAPATKGPGARNGTPSRSAPVPTVTKLAPLQSLLTERLSMLQQREKELNQDWDRILYERQAVRDDIQQTQELLLTLGVQKKKRTLKVVKEAGATPT